MSVQPLSLLDNIRQANGIESLKSYFNDLLHNNREKALEMINDKNLYFGTLFALRNGLQNGAAISSLAPLYRRALEITAELNGKKAVQAEKAMRSENNTAASILSWMFRTGYTDDGLDNEYDLLMEHSAALLIKSFRDTNILPELAETIYARHRKGKLIHELVWAFFEGRSPESLLLIAQRLNSTDSRDIALSKKLLRFVPGIEKSVDIPGCLLYKTVFSWLHENKPFLYYTGESFHLCNLPIHYAVSLIAKYLCHTVSIDNGEPLLALNESEKISALRLMKLEEHQQTLLADFSYMLYRKNIYQWNTWIRLSLEKQISLAVQVMERRLT